MPDLVEDHIKRTMLDYCAAWDRIFGQELLEGKEAAQLYVKLAKRFKSWTGKTFEEFLDD